MNNSFYNFPPMIWKRKRPIKKSNKKYIPHENASLS
jgi:hypothetical protein